MPPEVNARKNGPRARVPAKYQLAGGAQLAHGMGAASYPYVYYPPPYPMLFYPGPVAPAVHQPPSQTPSTTTTSEAADLDYPLIADWLAYCDRHACRGG